MSTTGTRLDRTTQGSIAGPEFERPVPARGHGDLSALPTRGMDGTAGVLDRTPGDGPMTSH